MLNEIEPKIKEIVVSEGVELVEHKIFNLKGKLIIRCLVDYPEGGITLDKCSKLNKMICSQLQDTLSDFDYTVEVNSPGLDRPLKEKKDFLKVKNKDVLLWFREAVLGKQFMEAKIISLDSDKILLKYKNKKISVDFGKIKLGKQKFRS